MVCLFLCVQSKHRSRCFVKDTIQLAKIGNHSCVASYVDRIITRFNSIAM
ncbi:unnamed protein product [Tenebrio molitor]|nr:unnamed protein product [Tenebrio molitor]